MSGPFSHLTFGDYEFREYPKWVKTHDGKEMIVGSRSEEEQVTTHPETSAAPVAHVEEVPVPETVEVAVESTSGDDEEPEEAETEDNDDEDSEASSDDEDAEGEQTDEEKEEAARKERAAARRKKRRAERSKA